MTESLQINNVDIGTALSALLEIKNGNCDKLLELTKNMDLIAAQLGLSKIFIPCTNPVLKAFYKHDHKTFIKDKKAQKYSKIAAGKGLLFTDGKEWVSERKMVPGMFGKEHLSEIYNDLYSTISNEIENTNDGIINAEEFFNRITIKAVGKAIFGGVTSKQEKEISTVVNSIIEPLMQKITSPVHLFIDPQNKKLHQGRKELFGVIGECIEQAKSSENDNLIKRYFSEGDNISKVTNIFIASFETTSTSFSWMLYEMINNEAVFQNLLEEVSLVDDIQNYDDTTTKLPYLTKCFNETIRLYPSIWITSRESPAKVEIDGVKVNRKDKIIFSPFVIHRNASNWENPNEFHPNRNYDSDNFIPFGMGPRACIGKRFSYLMAQLTFYHLFKKFDIKSEETELIKPIFHFTLKPSKAIKFNLISKS